MPKYRIINHEAGIVIPVTGLALAFKAAAALDDATDTSEWFVEHLDGTTLTLGECEGGG